MKNLSQLELGQNSAVINFNIEKLSKKQMFILKNLDPKSALKYVASIQGIQLSSYKDRQKINNAKEIKSAIYHGPLVRESKNHFLNLLQNRFKIGETRPQSKDLYYGIEIECLVPFDSMGLCSSDYNSSPNEMECPDCEGSGQLEFTHRDSGNTIEADCPRCFGSGMVDYESDEESNEDRKIEDAQYFFAKKVRSLKIKGLDVKHDGSIDNEGDWDFCPLELTILVKQNDLSDLEKLCSLLENLGAKVNASCGLHVHLDSRHLESEDLKALSKRFNSSLKFLLPMVPKSRRENRFCKASVSNLDGDRYHAINLTSFKKHSTVEVRLHSATTSFLKISNWLKILSAIHTRPLSHRLINYNSFFKYIEADEDLKNYVSERVSKFGGSLEESELNEPNCEAC